MGITTCKALNKVFSFPPLRWLVKPPALGKRETPERFVEWDFWNGAKSLFHFKPYDNIEHKSILDIGCGYGAKSVYYVCAGATFVTGIDLDSGKIEAARNLAEKTKVKNIRFDVGDAARLPYAVEEFDMVIFNDSFEHLDNPDRVLGECYRVLKIGGTAHIAFPPYGSPWGAHLFAHIRIPWAQFLFSEQTLARVWKEGEQRGKQGAVVYSPQRIGMIKEATRISALTHLNKMTIKRCEDTLKKIPFKLRLYHLRTLGNLFFFLTSFPTLREYIVTRVVAVLEK